MLLLNSDVFEAESWGAALLDGSLCPRAGQMDASN
jgi:hypothetical protein